MKLGYILLYVQNVIKTVEFYEKAFGLKRAFIHESNGYAEVETGGTKLGFVSLEMASSHGFKFEPVSSKALPAGFEIGFVTDDVPAAYQRAVQAGAQTVASPIQKPWGQVISYVRDCNGFLVEICSSMG